MGAKGSKGKYPVRLTVFISEEMDDKLDDLSEIMQVTKAEFVRYCLGTSLLGLNNAVGLMREQALMIDDN